MQSGIDSLKILFTQVLERVNIVNEENNYLRGMVFQSQQNSGSAFQQKPVANEQIQSNNYPSLNVLSETVRQTQLPNLNQTSLNLNRQVAGGYQNSNDRDFGFSVPTFTFQNTYKNNGFDQSHFEGSNYRGNQQMPKPNLQYPNQN